MQDTTYTPDSPAAKVYRVLGTSDDHDTYELCGRTELKRTVALECVDTGEVVHFGTDCAARAAGWTERELSTRIRAAEREQAAREQAARAAAWEAERAAYRAWLGAEAGEAVTAANEHDVAARLFGSPLAAWRAFSATPARPSLAPLTKNTGARIH